MYKLYEFAMPLTAKAKNLLLIMQNMIFFQDRYLSQDQTAILHNTPLDVSCRREGGWGATQTAGHVNQPLWCHLVTATQQTRDNDIMLA